MVGGVVFITKTPTRGLTPIRVLGTVHRVHGGNKDHKGLTYTTTMRTGVTGDITTRGGNVRGVAGTYGLTTIVGGYKTCGHHSFVVTSVFSLTRRLGGTIYQVGV